jgi:hypothetical protein
MSVSARQCGKTTTLVQSHYPTKINTQLITVNGNTTYKHVLLFSSSCTFHLTMTSRATEHYDITCVNCAVSSLLRITLIKKILQ